jgi:hypothetical protein
VKLPVNVLARMYRMSDGGVEEGLEVVQDAILEGMIPDDEAIQLIWPDHAVSARVTYASKVAIIDCYSPIVYRPIPAWTPKEGEAVLFLAQGGLRPTIGVIAKGQLWVGKNSFGINEFPMKPFDAEKLDTPWDQI